MSVDEKEERARTLMSMQENGKKSKQGCHKHYGNIQPPFLKIEPTHIVLDELHLLLLVGDILFRNVILLADSLDHQRKERLGETGYAVRELESIRDCGVSFQVKFVFSNACSGADIVHVDLSWVIGSGIKQMQMAGRRRASMNGQNSLAGTSG